ncbi:hypothetical protein BD770DRAFT_415679 [Pilaira anomala]|nr:hypothetical protein BD770DRAFT_415679 [Pilaira anomala]
MNGLNGLSEWVEKRLKRGVWKDHNYNSLVDEVSVGESLLAVRRIHGTFTCHICDKSLKTTTGFKSHLVSHGLKKMTISDTSLPELENSLQDLEDVSVSMSPGEIIHHSSPPEEDSIIGKSSKLLKKHKLLSRSQTTLASSDSITAETQEKTDKLMVVKLGRWVPIIYECGSEQHDLLTSARSATMLLQESSQTGACKEPAADLAKKLSTTHLEEVTLEHSNILSQDWLEYPQLRYCGSQMLTGAILAEKRIPILLSTVVEPYSRDSLSKKPNL